MTDREQILQNAWMKVEAKHCEQEKIRKHAMVSEEEDWYSGKKVSAGIRAFAFTALIFVIAVLIVVVIAI